GAEPYLVSRVEGAPDRIDEGAELDGLRRAAVDLFRRLVELIRDLPDDVAQVAEALPPRHIAYLIASLTPIDAAARQDVLELDPLSAKLRRLIDLLKREL